MMITTVVRRYSLLVGVLSALSGLASCDKDRNRDKDPEPVEASSTAEVSGVVLDEQYRPVAGAMVQVGTETASTSTNGTFSFEAAPVSGGRCVVHVSKSGYFEQVVGLRPQEAGVRTQVMLTSLGTPQAFTAGSASSLQMPGGMRVELPAGALTRNGAPYTGPAQAYARYISPSDPQLPRLMPGGDLAGISAANTRQMLISYGAVRVELVANGQPLQLAAGRPAELRFPAAGATQSTIPLWHFDTEAGIWKEEGRATRTGSEYVGTVSHFSAWNLDVGIDEGFVRGRLLDCSGASMTGVQLRVGQLEVATDEEGYFGSPVPAGIATTLQTAWPGTTSGGLQLAVPALAPGGVHELGTVTTCLASVKGRLVGCIGEPLTGVARLSTPAGAVLSSVYVGADGRFVLAGPAGTSAKLEVFAANGQNAQQTVQLPPLGAPPVNVGDLRLCSTTTPTGTLLLSYVINGDGRTNELVELRDAAHYYDRPQAFREGNTTRVTMGRSTQSPFNSADITIPGTDLGQFFTMNGILPSSLSIGVGSGSAIYYTSHTESGHILTFVITQYDAVGGRISGVFTGTLRKRVGTGPLTNTTVTISNGYFDFVRTADR